MRDFRLFLLLLLAAAGCGSNSGSGEDSLAEMRMHDVRLPGGTVIRAEMMVNPVEMGRGMMMRGALPRGRGMLFMHDKPGRYTYWMYQVKVPLDIIWMDSSRRIVEIAAQVPPCPGPAAQCPNYGTRDNVHYVLELGAGEAARLGLAPGQILSF